MYEHTIVLNNARIAMDDCEKRREEFRTDPDNIGRFLPPTLPFVFGPSFRTFRSAIANPTVADMRAALGGLPKYQDDEIGPFMRVSNNEFIFGRPKEDGAEERPSSTDG